jgi:hypothetical protein
MVSPAWAERAADDSSFLVLCSWSGLYDSSVLIYLVAWAFCMLKTNVRCVKNFCDICVNMFGRK